MDGSVTHLYVLMVGYSIKEDMDYFMNHQMVMDLHWNALMFYEDLKRSRRDIKKKMKCKKCGAKIGGKDNPLYDDGICGLCWLKKQEVHF